MLIWLDRYDVLPESFLRAKLMVTAWLLAKSGAAKRLPFALSILFVCVIFFFSVNATRHCLHTFMVLTKLTLARVVFFLSHLDCFVVGQGQT